MAKKLVSLKNIQDLCMQGQKEIVLDESLIMTPSAKDYIANQGIIIKYSSNKKMNMTNSLKQQDVLIEKIIRIVNHNYNINDERRIAEIIVAVLKKMM